MYNIFGWIDAISNIVVIISLCIAIYTFKKDHDRSRREGSVNLLFQWSSKLDRRASLATKYVEDLNTNQIKHLYAQEKVHFNISNKDEQELYSKIKALLNSDETQCNRKTTSESQEIQQTDITDVNCQSNNEFQELYLTEEESAELRWLIITYLNMLESVLVAWQHHSVDSSIIEQEFQYVYDTKNGDVLKKFRMMAGNENTYPAIEIFVNHLHKQRKRKLRRKHKI